MAKYVVSVPSKIICIFTDAGVDFSLFFTTILIVYECTTSFSRNQITKTLANSLNCTWSFRELL